MYCVTGAAGFIGYHLSIRLLEKGFHVLGIDNMNDYYDIELKQQRLSLLRSHPGFTFRKTDIADRESLLRNLAEFEPQVVIHLAAQAGVRYSLKSPETYVRSNLEGFVNLMECCRHIQVRHVLFASSSSVYGRQPDQPFREDQMTDHPVSLYAATKKANELIAHSYSQLFGIPLTGLRFFTVYGPWGRPDMAYFLFAKAILEGKPISVYNYGNMKRDFTYIDDAVEAVLRLAELPPVSANPNRTAAPFRVYNIGNRNPVRLGEMIAILEKQLGREAETELQPMQPGDVGETYADTSELLRATGFEPRITLQEGLPKFVEWYMSYRNGGC